MKANTQLYCESIRAAVAPARLNHDLHHPKDGVSEGSEDSGSGRCKTASMVRRRNQVKR